MINSDNHSFIHLPHLHLPFNRELRQLYASIAIRSFAVFLIGIFEPIYIFIQLERSLSKTFIYFGLISLMYAFLAPLGAKVLSKIGIKHSMLLGIPFLFLYYIGLWHVESLGVFIFVLTLLRAIHSMFYWPAYHIYFARASDKGHRGKEIGYRTIIISIVASAAPLLGGVIISAYGFPFLFIIVLTLLFSSMIPLFLSKEKYEQYHYSYFSVFKDLFKKKYRRKMFAFAARGTEFLIQAQVWPLYLFLLAMSYNSLGIITSASLMMGILFAFFIGKTSDKVGPEKILKIGVVINAILWPLKMLVQTPLDAFFANSLHRFGRTAAFIPFSTLFYDWSGEYKKNRSKLVVLSEVSVNGSKGLFLFLLAVIFSFSDNLAILFLVASALSLGMIFMAEKSRNT